MTGAILLIEFMLLMLVIIFSVLFWYWAKSAGLTLIIYKKIKKGFPLLGDIIYGVGISVVGSVFFIASSGIDLLSIKSLIGFFLIILGSIIRR